MIGHVLMRSGRPLKGLGDYHLMKDAYLIPNALVSEAEKQGARPYLEDNHETIRTKRDRRGTIEDNG